MNNMELIKVANKEAMKLLQSIDDILNDIEKDHFYDKEAIRPREPVFQPNSSIEERSAIKYVNRKSAWVLFWTSFDDASVEILRTYDNEARAKDDYELVKQNDGRFWHLACVDHYSSNL